MMRRLSLVLASAALLAACGTTTKGAAAPGDGLSGPLEPTQSATQSTGSDTTTSTTSSGTAQGPTSQLPATDGSALSGPLADVPNAVAAPIAKTGTLQLGIPYVDSQESNTFITAIGGAGLAVGDTKQNFQLRIDDLNKRGGILGRKVVPVFFRLDPSSQQSQYEQAACSYFTQDHKVGYVVDFGLGPNFLRCLAKKGVGIINTGMAKQVTSGYASLPGFVQPIAIALDRLATVEVARFFAVGYFGNLKTTKVGILYSDTPAFAAGAKALENELMARGIAVAGSQAIHNVATESDVAQVSSESQSAVLRMRSAGATHMLFVEENAWIAGFFGIHANTQGYYPRYGYTSNEPMGNIASNVPPKQLKDAVFVGWFPVQDVADPKQLTAAGQACLTFYTKLHITQSSANQRTALITTCETLDFLKAALTTAGVADGAGALLRGAHALKGFSSPSTFAEELSGSRRDGAAAVRDGVWDGGCTCFRYTSGPVRV